MPAPDGWTKTFTDPRLCAAIVDRLTFGGHIIETGSQSYLPTGPHRHDCRPLDRWTPTRLPDVTSFFTWKTQLNITNQPIRARR